MAGTPNVKASPTVLLPPWGDHHVALRHNRGLRHELLAPHPFAEGELVV
jgi:hypothetical protein